MSVLEVRNLSHSYGEIQAVRDVSLTLQAGEFVSLLGPSGSGKSTMLMVIAGFERPQAGTIAVLGRDITNLPPERRDMGIVFQSYALFPHLSVIDNVQYPLRMRHVPAKAGRRRALEALELVELADLAGARPQHLSGGQQQRVAFARAVVSEPSMLLMDEPLSALDRRLRQSMQYELRRLQRRIGATVLYVTHDQEEALVLSDRIAVMHKGRIMQDDAPRAVYDRPASAFVAEFLGEANVARVHRVEDRDGRTYRFEERSDICVDAVDGALESGALVIRPERLSVGPEALPGMNAIAGRIESSYFVGDKTRLEVDVGMRRRWKAFIGQGDDRPADLADGRSVTLSWAPGDGTVVPLDK